MKTISAVAVLYLVCLVCPTSGNIPIWGDVYPIDAFLDDATSDGGLVGIVGRTDSLQFGYIGAYQASDGALLWERTVYLDNLGGNADLDQVDIGPDQALYAAGRVRGNGNIVDGNDLNEPISNGGTYYDMLIRYDQENNGTATHFAVATDGNLNIVQIVVAPTGTELYLLVKASATTSIGTLTNILPGTHVIQVDIRTTTLNTLDDFSFSIVMSELETNLSPRSMAFSGLTTEFVVHYGISLPVVFQGFNITQTERDILLAGYDSSGTFAWSAPILRTFSGFFSQIGTDRCGNIFAAESVDGPTSIWDSTSDPSGAPTDVYDPPYAQYVVISKFDAAGEHIWTSGFNVTSSSLLVVTNFVVDPRDDQPIVFGSFRGEFTVPVDGQMLSFQSVGNTALDAYSIKVNKVLDANNEPSFSYPLIVNGPETEAGNVGAIDKSNSDVIMAGYTTTINTNLYFDYQQTFGIPAPTSQSNTFYIGRYTPLTVLDYPCVDYISFLNVGSELFCCFEEDGLNVDVVGDVLMDENETITVGENETHTIRGSLQVGDFEFEGNVGSIYAVQVIDGCLDLSNGEVLIRFVDEIPSSGRLEIFEFEETPNGCAHVIPDENALEQVVTVVGVDPTGSGSAPSNRQNQVPFTVEINARNIAILLGDDADGDGDGDGDDNTDDGGDGDDNTLLFIILTVVVVTIAIGVVIVASVIGAIILTIKHRKTLTSLSTRM